MLTAISFSAYFYGGMKIFSSRSTISPGIVHLREFADQSTFSGNVSAPLWACFDTNLQYAWHKPFSLQSNQVRGVDRKLPIALLSQVKLLRVIGEVTLILLSQYAGSKSI